MQVLREKPWPLPPAPAEDKVEICYLCSRRQVFKAGSWCAGCAEEHLGKNSPLDGRLAELYKNSPRPCYLCNRTAREATQGVWMCRSCLSQRYGYSIYVRNDQGCYECGVTIGVPPELTMPRCKDHPEPPVMIDFDEVKTDPAIRIPFQTMEDLVTQAKKWAKALP